MCLLGQGTLRIVGSACIKHVAMFEQAKDTSDLPTKRLPLLKRLVPFPCKRGKGLSTLCYNEALCMVRQL